MRKIFLLLLMILTVSGCGSSDDKQQPIKVGTLIHARTSREVFWRRRNKFLRQLQFNANGSVFGQHKFDSNLW